MQKNANELSWIYQINQIIRLSLPIIATSLAGMLSGMVGILMIARLGHKALAVSALVFSTYITLFVVCVATLFAVSILVGGAKGANQLQTIGKIVQQGWIVAILMGLPISLIVWYITPLLYLFHQSPELVQLAVSYFHATALCVLPGLLCAVIQQFFIGLSQARFNLFCTLVTAPLAMGLGYTLIFGKFGMPDLGMAGAAMATAIVLWGQFLFLIVYLKFNKKFEPYRLFEKLGHFDKQQFFLILKIGLPIGIQFGAELAAMALATYFMGWLGSSALAAQQIVSQFTTLVVMLTLGLSQAASVLVSQAIGRKDFFAVRHIGFSAMGLGVISMGLITLIYIFLPWPLINVYLDIHNPLNQPVIHIAILLFSIAGFLQIFDAIKDIAAGALRGLHDSQAPMHIGIVTVWLISLPCSYLLAFVVHWGPIGLRLGFLVGFIVCAVILVLRFQSHLKESSAMRQKWQGSEASLSTF